MEPSMIFFLAMFTLGIALALGMWSIRRTTRAERRNETSTLAELNRESQA